MLREEVQEGGQPLGTRLCHLRPHAVLWCPRRTHQPALAGIDLPDETTLDLDPLHLDVVASVPDLEMIREDGPLHQSAGAHRRLQPALARHLAALQI